MKRIVYLLPLLLFAVTLHAQDAAVLPPVFSSSSDDVTAAELRAHVTWLASDALEGRGTGTHTNDLAADYIAREFKRYGLKPAGDNGTYFQTFDVITGVETKENKLVMSQGGSVVSLEEGQFMPYTFSASGEFHGRVLYAGYGITDPAGKHDDYEGLDVTDGVVIVLSGYPEDADPHGSLPMLSSARAKALTAREHGATALIIIHRDEAVVQKFQYDRSPSSAGLPVAKINAELARMVLDAARIGGAVLDGAEVQPPTEGPEIELKTPSVTSSPSKASRVLSHKVEGTDLDDYFVVGAHYDHLGWGHEGSLYRGAEPMVHNGADDNASGTAGVMELAQWYAENPSRHSMIFMAFSGEEMGLLGSAHWAGNPSVPIEKVRAMFNLDMIGRLPDSTRRLNVQGIGTSPVWKEIVEKENDSEKFNLGLIEDGQGSSDHSSFYNKGVPVLFFFTGLHTDYHRPSDDTDKIDFNGEEQVTRYVAEIINAADALDEIPFKKVIKKDDEKVARFNVYVGTIPDYSENEHGFRITGTSPGSPADKAGMKEGDIIQKFGETEVRNIYDYMTGLSRHKPGDEIQVVVLRGEEKVTLNVGLVSK